MDTQFIYALAFLIDALAAIPPEQDGYVAVMTASLLLLMRRLR